MNKRADDPSGLATTEYKTEEEWVLEAGSHISVTLIADTTAQSMVPRNFNPITLKVETMTLVQSLKEQLCAKVKQASLTPDLLSIQLLTGGTLLNDAMSLAWYNITDQEQLIFTAKR